MSVSALTWTQVAAGRPPLLAVPVGSCEQHGPHLPLDTDTRIAVALVDALTRRRAGLVAGPPIAVGASGEHADFPGTLSIGTDVLALVLTELVRSADWSAGVVLVNAHGGNRAAIDRAVTGLRHEGRRVLAWSPSAAPGDDAHAGATETSVLLALTPAAVGPDRPRGALAPLPELAPALRRHGVRSVSANGVLGDATGADVPSGERWLARQVDDLAAAVDAWCQEVAP